MNPTYPVYVISKGRWESRLTSKALEKMKVPYSIVVEPQERDAYASVIDPEKVLALPFSNLGLGSIPARNWVWEHATQAGADRHWILDDNISGFVRLCRNMKVPVGDGSCFAVTEELVDRYENVPMAGLNYHFLVKRKFVVPPFYHNTRCYSCILLSNRHPEFRWRGRYNEDTDLSIQFLQRGYCTILMNAFLAEKTATMTMKGGNTDELYQGDGDGIWKGRLEMAESLRKAHDTAQWKHEDGEFAGYGDAKSVVPIRTSYKWTTDEHGNKRPQHHVDYRIYQKNKDNTLRLRPGVVLPERDDEHGIILQELVGDRWERAA